MLIRTDKKNRMSVGRLGLRPETTYDAQWCNGMLTLIPMQMVPEISMEEAFGPAGLRLMEQTFASVPDGPGFLQRSGESVSSLIDRICEEST
jgi:hypothetical protein